MVGTAEADWEDTVTHDQADEIDPDKDSLRRVSQAWADDTLATIIAADTTARMVGIGPDDDVRHFTRPGERDDLARALLVNGADFALWAFNTSEDGSPYISDRASYALRTVGNQILGPLAAVQVYATDPYGDCRGQWRGKSHGLCLHQEELDPDSHQLMRLDEFALLHRQDPGDDPWRGSGWCSKCGGYAIRRLTQDQYAYYVQALRRARDAEERWWRARQPWRDEPDGRSENTTV